MSKLLTLEGLRAGMTPEQREALAQLNERRGGDPHITLALRAGAKAPTTGPRWRTAVESSARRDGDRVTLVFKGLVLLPGDNEREHWTAEARRKKWLHKVVEGALALVSMPPGPWVVTVNRQGRRRLDVHDNLPSAAKYVIDPIATRLGVDDGDLDRFRCTVTQQFGDYVVRVVIEGRAW